MKKILTAVLAFALAASMGVTAFAQTADDKTPVTGDVQGQYVPGNDAPPTISVAVTWEDMTFTYRKSADEWDPATHEFTTPSADGVWDAMPKNITIQNRSNVSVLAGIAYHWNGDIKGGFGPREERSESLHSTALSVGSSWCQPVYVTSGTLSADGDIGTITVSISSFE